MLWSEFLIIVGPLFFFYPGLEALLRATHISAVSLNLSEELPVWPFVPQDKNGKNNSTLFM